MFKEFKEFALRGNVVDLAVGVIIGTAFSAIVNSIVNDIIMPLIGAIFGKIDFSNLFIALDGNTYETLLAAQEVGAPVFAYGNFITAILNFLIIAFSIFLLIKGLNKLSRKKQEAEPEPASKECPFCFSQINPSATRCPNCTSEL
ncbi:MAG: large conductance mechanosensitive channel protein MscL [Christensenellales bacterium]|jgi:large conductance mechanosensitive channel